MEDTYEQDTEISGYIQHGVPREVRLLSAFKERLLHGIRRSSVMPASYSHGGVTASLRHGRLVMDTTDAFE